MSIYSFDFFFLCIRKFIVIVDRSGLLLRLVRRWLVGVALDLHTEQVILGINVLEEGHFTTSPASLVANLLSYHHVYD